jgi:hypothetical protein
MQLASTLDLECMLCLEDQLIDRCPSSEVLKNNSIYLGEAENHETLVGIQNTYVSMTNNYHRHIKHQKYFH